MAKLKKHRTRAMRRQDGRCYYCDQPMWSGDHGDFAKQHGFTPGQARNFQCTAEHLHARCDGGTNAAANIVAACRYCNQSRHQRKAPMTPEAFRSHVQKRLARGGWSRLPKHAALDGLPRSAGSGARNGCGQNAR